jgi:CRISPR-associated exonuclease Cas4
LKSEQYQLIGKSDLIEFENGEFYPIEYKRGRKGEWDNDELQGEHINFVRTKELNRL